MFYNWYDPETGEKLTVWPDDGSTVYPFMSSVDNGWIAAALRVAAAAEPDVRAAADAIRAEMNFGFYYDADALGEDAPAGLIRGGFWDEVPAECYVEDNYGGGETLVYYTCHHYGAFNTEPRIASYLGIVDGTIPREHYFGGWRTFPDKCDWSWPEQKPVGEWREYLGVPVFEGAYRYRGPAARADVGRQHVRGADGAAVRARGEVGQAVVEDQPPADGGRPYPARHGRGGYGYWGFSPVEQPGRRLPRVRRRPDRDGGRTATRQTRSGRRSTTASRAAGRERHRRPSTATAW